MSNLMMVAFGCHSPTVINKVNINVATKNMVTSNLCFTQLFISHLMSNYSYFHVKELDCYLPPDECFVKYLSFYMKATYLPIHLHIAI